jgi:sigma-E factor negative regulatory protein RseB
MIVSLGRHNLLLLLCLVSPAVHAADAQALLSRIQRAPLKLDYEGTFVYQHGDQLDTLSIAHQMGSDGVRERLVSLNGVPREIIRNDREVRCYLPDESSVMVEHRRADKHNFPALLPESLSTLGKNYKIRTGKDGRVAGRKAHSVIIRPRDGYRYGYELWADAETSLLLKASLLDDRGTMIEQYMFTQLSIGKPLTSAQLEPQNPGKNFVWHKPDDEPAVAVESGWHAQQLPAGYTLSARMMRRLPDRKQPVEHLVYSDGLAVVSVFIEPVSHSRKSPTLAGVTQLGAIHAFGRETEGHQITVIGETPAAAVDLIGESMALRP